MMGEIVSAFGIGQSIITGCHVDTDLVRVIVFGLAILGAIVGGLLGAQESPQWLVGGVFIGLVSGAVAGAIISALLFKK